MSIAINQVSQTEHLEYLNKELESKHMETADCLVVADGDQHIVERVVEALDSDSLVVMPLSSSEWREHLPEIVRWAADHRINHVVVVGHSAAARSAETSRSAHPEGLRTQESSPSFQRIVAGARSMEDRLNQAKQQYAAAMEQLVRSPRLADTTCDDDFHLTPLFYVSHSDFFLCFNFNTKKFIPVTS